MAKEKQFAGFWSRLLATLIDGFILTTTQRLIHFAFKSPLQELFSLTLSLGYAPLTLYYWQATLGKMVFNLKVVSQDGKKLEIFQVLLREWVGKFISALVFFLGFIWIGIDEKKQGWHDKLAGTLVLKT